MELVTKQSCETTRRSAINITNTEKNILNIEGLWWAQKQFKRIAVAKNYY